MPVALVAALGALSAVAGCKEDNIRSYVVQRVSPVAPASAPSGASASAPARSPGIAWTVPDTWTEVAASGAMRVATFHAHEGEGEVLEIAVTTIPGQAGGLLANVNRWRGQIGLAPIGEQDLASAVPPIEDCVLDAWWVDISTGADAPEAKRMLGAIIDDGAGSMWFVKAVGAPELVGAHADEVRAFSASFRRGAGEVQPSQAGGAGAAPSSDWTPPSHWVADTGAASFILAAFNIPVDEGQCRFTVTALGGDGGGDLPNVNRWRGQMGLEPVASLDEQDGFDIQRPGGGTVRAYDMTSDPGETGSAAQRIIAVIEPGPDATRYYKISGPASGVEREREAFVQAVASMGG